MSDENIQYDAGGFVPEREKKSGGGLAGMLIRSGFAKDDKQANTILAGLLILAIVIGVGVWFI